MVLIYYSVLLYLKLVMQIAGVNIFFFYEDLQYYLILTSVWLG